MDSRTTPLFKAVNAAMAPALRSRRNPEAAWEKAVHQAERVSGVAVDGDDEQWIADFEFLIRCVAAVPGLSPMGWATTVMDARARLVNRLRIRELHRRHPEIGAEPIEKPVFIVGLPRTATTLSHQVLAASPACRGPLMWELTHTGLEPDPAAKAKRIKRARRQFSTTKWAPELAHIHPLDVTKPEESMFLLPHGVYHLLFHAPMPKYREWFAERDTSADYRYLKEALQVLQYGRERRRWILKYPFDICHMPVIQRVFPGARFVWTHRDPVAVAGSLCSLAELSQSLFLTRPDRETVGRLTLELMVEAVEAGREFRRRHLAAVVDVPYHRLVSSPERYVPELHERLDIPWTFDDGERLVDSLNRSLRERERDRRHEYRVGDFGLDSEELEKAFADYQRWTAAIDY
ncbi:sulfotransferase family protein [Glycomyces tenuis]|uniref:sulfotransferase family protein n=1 Tax=Glycomyces tenuis TaxID=58116 RepID=UPI000400E906|nr:sulfotransferase [Glycomyces tenuis]